MVNYYLIYYLSVKIAIAFCANMLRPESVETRSRQIYNKKTASPIYRILAVCE